MKKSVSLLIGIGPENFKPDQFLDYCAGGVVANFQLFFSGEKTKEFFVKNVPQIFYF